MEKEGKTEECCLAFYGIKDTAKTSFVTWLTNGRLRDHPRYGVTHEGKFVHEGNTLTLYIADVLSYSRDLEFHIYDQRFEDVQGVALVYSITCRKSFEWLSAGLNIVSKAAWRLKTILIVGSKADLEEQRQVTTEEGMEFARQCNAVFLESSAKFGINVGRIFHTLVDGVLSDDENNLPIFVLPNQKNNKCAIAYACDQLKLGQYLTFRVSLVAQNSRNIGFYMSLAAISNPKNANYQNYKPILLLLPLFIHFILQGLMTTRNGNPAESAA